METMMINICLYYRLVKIVIMSVSFFHKDRNERILRKLKISDTKYREKLEKCSYCCDCTNKTAHICIFCGRTVAEMQDQEASNPQKMESSIEISLFRLRREMPNININFNKKFI